MSTKKLTKSQRELIAVYQSLESIRSLMVNLNATDGFCPKTVKSLAQLLGSSMNNLDAVINELE